MTDGRLRAALGHVKPRWDAERTERTWQTLSGRRARRRQRAVVAAGAGVALVAALALWGVGDFARWGALERAPEFAEGSAPADGERRLALKDGSSVELLDERARIALGESSERAVELRLREGRARFDVVPRAGRTFRVRAGEVLVQVLGTRFTVEERAGRIGVEVERGRVSVSWDGGARELGAGEGGWFPPSDVERAAFEAERARGTATQVEATSGGDRAGSSAIPSGPPEASASARREGDAEEGASPLPTASPSAWRERAVQGEFKQAYDLLQHPEASAPRGIAELLLAADAARLSGHPAEAVPYLREAVERYPRDARAPLAAFTLGNVLMNQLGLPREAAAAYARARRGTSSTALAQDALARQVEAAYRAGDESEARRLAAGYESQYPSGRRRQAVRRFGGLQ